jgi:hypothetical protein
VLLERRQRVAAHRREQGRVVPGRLGDKMVQRLVRRADPERLNPRCHRLDALALARQQEAGGVGAQRLAPVGVAEHRAQELDIAPKTIIPACHRPPARYHRPRTL